MINTKLLDPRRVYLTFYTDYNAVYLYQNNKPMKQITFNTSIFILLFLFQWNLLHAQKIDKRFGNDGFLKLHEHNQILINQEELFLWRSTFQNDSNIEIVNFRKIDNEGNILQSFGSNGKAQIESQFKKHFFQAEARIVDDHIIVKIQQNQTKKITFLDLDGREVFTIDELRIKPHVIHAIDDEKNIMYSLKQNLYKYNHGKELIDSYNHPLLYSSGQALKNRVFKLTDDHIFCFYQKDAGSKNEVRVARFSFDGNMESDKLIYSIPSSAEKIDFNVLQKNPLIEIVEKNRKVIIPLEVKSEKYLKRLTTKSNKTFIKLKKNSKAKYLGTNKEGIHYFGEMLDSGAQESLSERFSIELTAYKPKGKTFKEFGNKGSYIFKHTMRVRLIEGNQFLVYQTTDEGSSDDNRLILSKVWVGN